jgi:hypothetical protein
MMMRQLALVLGRQAARLLHPANPDQARAMLAELDYIEGSSALAWAFGCLIASWQQRASLLAVGIVAAQSSVGLAAGSFGFLHAYASFENLRSKVLLLAGQAPAPPPGSFLETIHAQSLEHWLCMFLMFSAGGMLHVIAAMMMVIGSNRRVVQLAAVIVAFDLVVPLVAATQVIPSIFPLIYAGLIVQMALAAAAFAVLWRWDEQRLAASTCTAGF